MTKPAKRLSTYTAEFKRRAVLLCRGKPQRQVAEELGVSVSSLRRWIANSATYGEPDAASRHADDCMCMNCFRRAFT